MKDEANSPRPPGDRGQGRMAYAPEDKRRPRSIALTDAQWEQFRALGTDWLIEKLADDVKPSLTAAERRELSKLRAFAFAVKQHASALGKVTAA